MIPAGIWDDFVLWARERNLAWTGECSDDRSSPGDLYRDISTFQLVVRFVSIRQVPLALPHDTTLHTTRLVLPSGV